MGNVMAAAPPSPGAPGSTGMPVPPPSDAQGAMPPEMPEEPKPGQFESLHSKTKDIFPSLFEGAKLVINRPLSNHFVVNHTFTMSQYTPSGYRFGATYIGQKQLSPTESYPVLVSDIDPSGNLNAQIVHAPRNNVKLKTVVQMQNNEANAQFSADYRGEDFTSSIAAANLDIINPSGVFVGHYLQRVTDKLDLGAELVYQFDSKMPGAEVGVYTLAGRYSADKWTLSGNITPMAAGAHLCYHQKVNDTLQMGAELEGSLRSQECTATVGYQIDLKNVCFKGQVDSNFTVGAVMEKKLMPLPFTFQLSAHANHNKNAYRFGLGMILGG